MGGKREDTVAMGQCGKETGKGKQRNNREVETRNQRGEAIRKGREVRSGKGVGWVGGREREEEVVVEEDRTHEGLQ